MQKAVRVSYGMQANESIDEEGESDVDKKNLWMKLTLLFKDACCEVGTVPNRKVLFRDCNF